MTFAPALQIVSDAGDKDLERLERAVDRACRAIARGRSGVHARLDIVTGETEWTIDPEGDRIVIVEPTSVWRLSHAAKRAEQAPLADLERLLSWITAAVTLRTHEPVRTIEHLAASIAWAAAKVLSAEWSAASVSSHTPARPGRAYAEAAGNPRIDFLPPAVTAIHGALPNAVRLTRRSDTLWRLSPVEAEARSDDAPIVGMRAVRILGAMPTREWFGAAA